MKSQTVFGIGTLLCMTGIVAGAFGAHALRGSLSPKSLEIYEVAVRYHMYSGFGFLATAWATESRPGALSRLAARLLGLGVLLFSGSLYALALSDVHAIGFITPIGGLATIVGWACLAWNAFRRS